jgi:hypothetical protein
LAVKLYQKLIFVFILFSPGITLIPLVPAEVGDIVINMTNIRLSPETSTQRDVSFEPFALYQVEANTTPIDGPEGEEMVVIRIRPYEGGGGKLLLFRTGSSAINTTFRPQSSNYYVEILNYDDVDTYWINLTITQIEGPISFTIPSEGLGNDVVIPLLGTTVVPLLVLFTFVFLKQRRAAKELT